MERPSRGKKQVNYSDFQDDDDEDFAVKAPAIKKARLDDNKSKKQTTKSSSQESTPPVRDRKERTPLSDKLYDRDLQAALTLSMLHTTAAGAVEESSHQRHQVDENEAKPPTPPLSNCSVDSNSHGLNDITNEQLSQSNSSKQRKAATMAQTSLKEETDGAADEDYLPQNTPDSESESDFSGEDESEDEEFTVKKAQKKSKQSKDNKKTPPPKKEKQPLKATKPKAPSTTTGTPTSSKGRATAAVSRSPVVTKAAPALKKAPATPPMSRPIPSTSPAGSRVPKWNPPGVIGRSPGTSQASTVKSPGQGLRLGLSRLARVKPLHPNTAAH
ncbi:hypothetical protein ACEWY4_001849 [Coilia grayii]|uniref:RAD51 interacting motif domain-containing protein n=1 Tax=Coilia grayii TaxID=363190 RepID=A0ABD1KUK5_9TELE